MSWPVDHQSIAASRQAQSMWKHTAQETYLHSRQKSLIIRIQGHTLQSRIGMVHKARMERRLHRGNLGSHLLFSLALVAFDRSCAFPSQVHGKLHTRGAAHWRSMSIEKGSLCLPQDQIPLHNISLTIEEMEVLPDICWRQDLGLSPVEGESLTHRGVPQGVQCSVITWWDASFSCLWFMCVMRAIFGSVCKPAQERCTLPFLSRSCSKHFVNLLVCHGL